MFYLQPDYITDNNEDIPLEERIKTLITDRNKLGPRDINSSRAAAMDARRRLENTSTRPTLASEAVPMV